jgi:hypothetical protein
MYTVFWWVKRPLGRKRRIWENNFKMDFLEVVWGAWIGLFWLRILLYEYFPCVTLIRSHKATNKDTCARAPL